MRKNANSFVPFGARKLLLGVLAVGAFLVGYALLVSPTQAAPAPKIDICHIPPGNPGNFHTIRISENAFAAHLAHGDLGGPCDNVCAALCDDGDACTIDDSVGGVKIACESQGCPTGDRDAVDCDLNKCLNNTCDSVAGCQSAAPLPGDPRLCPPPDNCTTSECAPDTGECVDTGKICPDGFSCNLANGECEREATCFTMRDAANSGDDIEACINTCAEFCPLTTCEQKRLIPGLVASCLLGNLDVCDEIDDLARPACPPPAGICPPPEPEPGCPCWDGTTQHGTHDFPPVPPGHPNGSAAGSLQDVWDTLAPPNCTTVNRCLESNDDTGKERSEALCVSNLSGNPRLLTLVNFLPAAEPGLQYRCSVQTEAGLLVSHPDLTEEEYVICRDEHDAFTANTEFPPPPLHPPPGVRDCSCSNDPPGCGLPSPSP